MSGLAECLSHMHSLTPSPCSFSDSPQSIIGILHGDISPENILVMPHYRSVSGSNKFSSGYTPGDLVFSDFGLSTILYADGSPREIPFPGNRTFEAPEDRLRAPPGRPSDVWSLGTVFLEFFVWLVLGRDVLQQFFDDRCTPDVRSGGKINSDFFYDFIADKDGDIVGMKTKDIVKEYVRRVRDDKSCTEPVQQAMDIVDGMLVVDTSRRLTAQDVAEKFRQVVEVLEL